MKTKETAKRRNIVMDGQITFAGLNYKRLCVGPENLCRTLKKVQSRRFAL